MRRWITARRGRCTARRPKQPTTCHRNDSNRAKQIWKINTYPQRGSGFAAARNLWNGFRGPLVPSIYEFVISGLDKRVHLSGNF